MERQICSEQKYGGNAVVYEIKPKGDVWHTNTNEYVADAAKITRVAAVYDKMWKEPLDL